MRLLLSILLILLQLCAFAQELFVPAHLVDKGQLVAAPQLHNNASTYYNTPRFNDVFNPFPARFYLPETSFYKHKKVKQVWVLQASNKDTIYGITLNELGQIIETYNTNYGLVMTEHFYYDEKGAESLITKRYKVFGVAAKVDSVFFKNEHYLSGDTLYAYTCKVEKVYKSGARLNAQNAYYNHEFLNRYRVFENAIGNPPGLKRIYANNLDGNIYLEKAFKADYTIDSFHLCTEYSEAWALPIAGELISGKRALKRLRKQNKPKPQFGQSSISFHADGESFREPFDMKTMMTCGSSFGNNNFVPDRYAYLTNDKGLHESYVNKAHQPYHVIYHFVYGFFD